MKTEPRTIAILDDQPGRRRDERGPVPVIVEQRQPTRREWKRTRVNPTWPKWYRDCAKAWYAVTDTLWVIAAVFRGLYAAARWLYRRRRPLAPVYAVAGYGLVGASTAPHRDGWTVTAVLCVIAAGFVAAYGHWWRPKTERPLRLAEAVYLWVSTAACTVTAVCAAVWLRPTPGIALLALGVVGMPWWWHHYMRPDPVPEPVDERIQIFNRYLARPNAPLHGCVMYGLADDPDKPGNWSAVIDGQGEKTAEHVISQRGRIAGAYRMSKQSLLLERLDDDSEATVRLIVVKGENPTWVTRTLTEDMLGVADGCFKFGTAPDGQWEHARLWLEDAGAALWLFTGDNRSGKSKAAELALIQATWTGKVWPIVHDPQGGVSMPAWAGRNGVAPWSTAHPLSARMQLDAMEEVVRARSRILAERDLTAWDPVTCQDMPMLVWFVDEMYEPLRDPIFAARYTQVALRCAKVGLGLWGAVQYPSQAQLGGQGPLRSQFIAHNVTAFRNAQATMGAVVLSPGLPLPNGIPKRLPNGESHKGMHVSDMDAPGSGRDLYPRTILVPKEDSRAWARRCAQRFPELDPATGAAIAAHWAASILLERFHVAIQDGRRPPVDLHGVDWHATVDYLPHYLPDPDVNTVELQEVYLAHDATPNRVTAAVTGNPGPARALPAATVSHLDEHAPIGDRALAWFADQEPGSIHYTNTVAAALNTPKGNSVTKALGRLADRGLIIDAGHGRWQVPA